MRFRANSMFVQLSLVLIVLQCVIVFVSWWLIAGRVSAFFTQQQVDELRVAVLCNFVACSFVTL